MYELEKDRAKLVLLLMDSFNQKSKQTIKKNNESFRFSEKRKEKSIKLCVMM